MLNKEFVYPEHGEPFSLKENIGLYSWRSNHHFEHVKLALKYKGEFS